MSAGSVGTGGVGVSVMNSVLTGEMAGTLVVRGTGALFFAFIILLIRDGSVLTYGSLGRTTWVLLVTHGDGATGLLWASYHSWYWWKNTSSAAETQRL